MTIIGAGHNQRAISTVRDFLVSKARAGDLTTYEDTWALARQHGNYFGPHDRELWDLLGVISSQELDAGRPPLSVLVTHKSGERKDRPGEGFFTLMKMKGTYLGDDDATFAKHADDTFNYWQSK